MHVWKYRIKEADLILQVIDFSDVNYKKHMEVTEETLKELDAGHIPVIYVYNKADLCMPEIPRCTDNRIYMSAQDETCIRTTGSSLEMFSILW